MMSPCPFRGLFQGGSTLMAVSFSEQFLKSRFAAPEVDDFRSHKIERLPSRTMSTELT